MMELLLFIVYMMMGIGSAWLVRSLLDLSSFKTFAFIMGLFIAEFQMQMKKRNKKGQ